MMTIEVRGADDVVRRLERVAAGLEASSFRAGVADAARSIEAAAKADAPVVTGRLRASLKTEVRIVPGARVVAAVGSRLAYAPAVEYGTRRRPGRGFLRRALADQGARVAAAVRRRVERMTWNG